MKIPLFPHNIRLFHTLVGGGTWLAQSVERSAFNRVVEGSIPSSGAHDSAHTFLLMQLDCPHSAPTCSLKYRSNPIGNTSQFCYVCKVNV